MQLTTAAYRKRFYDNSYESTERNLVRAHLAASDRVLELGGSIGVVSAAINRILEIPSGEVSHVVVEANPQIVSALALNRDRNQLNFVIENGVVTDHPFVKFFSHQLTNGNTISGSGGFPVPGISLGSLLKKYGQPTALVMDIEGGEFEFLDANLRLLSQLRIVIVEYHTHIGGEDLIARSREHLSDNGFSNVDSLFDGKNYTDVWKRDASC